MIINLDNITIASTTSLSFSSKNCSLNSCSTVTTTLNYSNSLRIGTNKNFSRIIFPSTRNYFSNKALSKTTSYTCSDTNADVCFNDNKILSCKNNYFWNLANTDDQSCSTKCTAGIPNYLLQKSNSSTANSASTNSNTGYCTGDCDASTSGKIQCSTLDLTPNVYSSGLTCNGTNYSIFSFFCIQTDLKYAGNANEPPTGALLYSQKFNSPTIVINVNPTLTLYHFEMWFLPDSIFTWNYGGTKYYVLYTNSIRIKKDTNASNTINDYKVYLGAGASAIIPGGSSTIQMKYNQWNKITYSVVANASNSNNFDVKFYYINSSSTDYIFANNSSGTSLSQIVFCTNSCTSYFTDGSWFSGAYKLLKVWDATNFSLDLYRSLDI